jgi:hypothetical protein
MVLALQITSDVLCGLKVVIYEDYSIHFTPKASIFKFCL